VGDHRGTIIRLGSRNGIATEADALDQEDMGDTADEADSDEHGVIRDASKALLLGFAQITAGFINLIDPEPA
jgi:hypothetical protein